MNVKAPMAGKTNPSRLFGRQMQAPCMSRARMANANANTCADEDPADEDA